MTVIPSDFCSGHWCAVSLIGRNRVNKLASYVCQATHVSDIGQIVVHGIPEGLQRGRPLWSSSGMPLHDLRLEMIGSHKGLLAVFRHFRLGRATYKTSSGTFSLFLLENLNRSLIAMQDITLQQLSAQMIHNRSHIFLIATIIDTNICKSFL